MPPKRYTKDELKAAFKKLADETGLPAEQVAAFATALDHDAFAARVGSELVLTRSDYSRLLNEEVAPAKQLYETKYQELVNTWYPSVQQTYGEAVKAREAAERRIKLYEAQNGPLEEAIDNRDGTLTTATGDIVRKADVEKMLAEARAAAKQEALNESVGIQLLANELASDHWTEFREVLDLRPLTASVKAARDRKDMQFDLRDAYTSEFGTKIEEKRKAARTKEIDDAVAAARVDERSKFVSSPAAAIDEDSVGPFFAVQSMKSKQGAKTPTEQELEADFVNGLREGERAQAQSA